VPEVENFKELRHKRDRAVACAWLSFAISLAILNSNFRDHSSEIGNITKAIEVHKGLLIEAKQILQDNLDALSRTESALENLKKAEASANQ